MALKRMDRISSGSYDFNKWLYGGYERDVISMLAGPPGSGKTNFTILAACSQARKGNKVIFVDTEGGFSIDRVRQIVGDSCERRCCPPGRSFVTPGQVHAFPFGRH